MSDEMRNPTKPELKYLICLDLGKPKEVLSDASIKHLKALGYINNRETITDKGRVVVGLIKHHVGYTE